MKNIVSRSTSGVARVFAGVCLVVATCVMAQVPDAAIDRQRLEQRLTGVETLIERSSGARQIESSGDPGARKKREEARQLYRQAREAFAAGQLAKASDLLPAASMQMFEAVRLAAPGEVTAPKARIDFAVRLDSANSLLAALRRVATEKNNTTGAAESARDIEKMIANAQKLAAEDKMETARAELDRAYLLAKASISSMRSGDTLVRSLNFATREEEYRYEIDRNDTHQMLLKVLVDGKPRRNGHDALVENALQLRVQAEGRASAADHAGAIKLLEDSTRELIKAIRGAGVFIPG